MTVDQPRADAIAALLDAVERGCLGTKPPYHSHCSPTCHRFDADLLRLDADLLRAAFTPAGPEGERYTLEGFDGLPDGEYVRLAPADPTADPVEHRPVTFVSGDRRWHGCVCGHPADPTADLLLQWGRKAKNASGDDFHDGLRAAFNECIRDLRADLAKSQPATGTDPS